MADLLLRGAHLDSGEVVDVTLAAGRIERVAPGGALRPEDHAQQVLDLDGYLLLAAPAEPHAHLDKALTADLVANPTGDLLGAIEAYQASYGDRTVSEIVERSRRAAHLYLAHGCTAIRTHVDVGAEIGTRAAEALLILRDELADRIDLQIVALAGRPDTGAEGAANRAAALAAYDAGVDVVGGAPHLDPSPAESLAAWVSEARARDLALDLHLDESLDPASVDLDRLARAVGDFEHPVAASHCVALGAQLPDAQRKVADAVAVAGISVVTLPQTNLFLQARGVTTSPPRGLTAVATLLEAGVNVAAGGDNLQDPFNVVGRGDPLETASLLVCAAHLDTGRAYHAVSAAARHAMGLEPVTIRAGAPAELLAVRATSVRAAIASAPPDRMVFHRGRLVARTTSERSFPVL